MKGCFKNENATKEMIAIDWLLKKASYIYSPYNQELEFPYFHDRQNITNLY